jgi:hypothetical protein
MISKLGHWYFEETRTYIRVFKTTGVPHLLLIHVPECLFLGEIRYHTILQSYNASLAKYKKMDFIPYGFHIDFYMVKYVAHDKQERLIQLEYWFPTGRFHKNDPKGLILQHT